MGVRMRLLLSASLAGALGLASQAAFGWGSDGHKMIGELGVKTLPADLPDFLHTPDAIQETGYLSPEPDRVVHGMATLKREKPEAFAAIAASHSGQK